MYPLFCILSILYSGKFYGSAFVEFNTVDAAKGAMGFTGKKVLGRPMKVHIYISLFLSSNHFVYKMMYHLYLHILPIIMNELFIYC